VMSIRTGSDDRYTIKPFFIGRLESSESMVLSEEDNNISPKEKAFCRAPDSFLYALVLGRAR
jgi:hypothetical protein